MLPHLQGQVSTNQQVNSGDPNPRLDQPLGGAAELAVSMAGRLLERSPYRDPLLLICSPEMWFLVSGIALACTGGH